MLTDTIKWIEIYYVVLDIINCQQINYWVYRGKGSQNSVLIEDSPPPPFPFPAITSLRRCTKTPPTLTSPFVSPAILPRRQQQLPIPQNFALNFCGGGGGDGSGDGGGEGGGSGSGSGGVGKGSEGGIVSGGGSDGGGGDNVGGDGGGGGGGHGCGRSGDGDVLSV
jgi:hypothetical protein